MKKIILNKNFTQPIPEQQKRKKSALFWRGGFTIVEMIMAVAVFSIVAVFSVAAVVSIADVNKRSQTINSTVNNLNYALETMVRNIRTGSNYYCASSCPNSINFTDQRGDLVTYKLEGSVIKRVLSGVTLDLTSPEVIIERLEFKIGGSGNQPNVIILVGGKMILKGGKESRFDVETMAVQRFFNK